MVIYEGHQENYLGLNVFTDRNEVVAKVMFLLVSVILSGGGGLSASVHAGKEAPPHWEGSTPHWEGSTPPGKEAPPWEGSPPGREHPPPREGSTPRRKHTPAGKEAPPWKEAPPDPGKEAPPWEGSTPREGSTTPGRKHPPRHTVNERPVRILLECIFIYVGSHLYVLNFSWSWTE